MGAPGGWCEGGPCLRGVGRLRGDEDGGHDKQTPRMSDPDQEITVKRWVGFNSKHPTTLLVLSCA